jgi:hypothetical protein
MFRDPDFYHLHLATCGAEHVAETETVPEPKKATGKKTADSRRQIAAEKKNDDRPQTADTLKEDVENPLASAAVCGLPSAVSAPPVKPPKFKT